MAKPEKNYHTAWAEISERVADNHESGAYHLGGMRNAFKAQEAGKAAFREFLLECFFDKLIAEKSTSWHEPSKESAVLHELIKRHSWGPAEISRLSDEELLIVFHDDLISLKLTDHAYMACQSDLNYCRLGKLLDAHA